MKLHLTESLSIGLATRFQPASGKIHERSQLPTGEWIAGELVLLDLGSHDFCLFVPRVKDDASFDIVEELRIWRITDSAGRTPAAGRPYDLQRKEIDTRITLSFDRKRGS